MKIIVNRGFNKIFSRIIILKNSQEIIVCSSIKDYYEIDAKKGDRIVVKLKAFSTFTSQIANFVCNDEYDTYYICPTIVLRGWELLNFKVLPYFSLLFLVLKISIMSELYIFFCTGMILLTALSLMSLQFCMLIPALQVKLFKLYGWDRKGTNFQA